MAKEQIDNNILLQHEVLDRGMLICNLISSSLLNHPYLASKESQKEIQEVTDKRIKFICAVTNDEGN